MRVPCRTIFAQIVEMMNFLLDHVLMKSVMINTFMLTVRNVAGQKLHNDVFISKMENK